MLIYQCHNPTATFNRHIKQLLLTMKTNLPEARKILFFVEMKTQKRRWTYLVSFQFVWLFLRMTRVPN